MQRKIKGIINTLILSLIIWISSSSTCNAEVDTSGIESYLNGVVSQQQINQTNNPKYADRNNTTETIDSITGNLVIKETDLYLTGKNGLDLPIRRIYNSSQDTYDKNVTFSYKPSSWSDKKFAYAVSIIDESGKEVIIPFETLYDAYLCYLIFKDDPAREADIEQGYYLIGNSNYTATNYTDQNTYNKVRYQLGAGWSFAFPSVQVETEWENTYLYYHDGSGSVYEVTGTSDTINSNLKGYQGNDVKFLSDNGTYINGDNILSKYKFINSEQTTYYFSEDGRLLGIKDRFNNQIMFYYGLSEAKDTIKKIVDSVGRTITLSYVDNNIDVTVTAPNETNQLKITYQREFINQTVNNETITYPILKRVIDPLGRSTFFERYIPNNMVPTEGFTYASKDVSTAITRERYLLGSIVYPGSKTVYEYEKVQRNLGVDGITETYRVKSRHDEIQRKNNSTQTMEWLTDNNRVNYAYSGDCSGYPAYYNEDTLPDTYQFNSEATSVGSGLKIKTIFNGSKQLIQTESIASNNEKSVVKNLEYDATYKYLPTKTEASEYASDGTLAHTYYSGTTYTAWGGVSSITAPLTSQQYNDAGTKAKYTTSYSYENATYQYYPTKKQWYQSDFVQLDETYGYNSEGRISSYKNAKGEITSYTYSTDANGNRIEEISQPLENGKTARTRQVYGSETSYAYPKETLSYYTDRQGAGTETKITRTYNMLLGLVKTETDNENKTTTYTYDNLGRVTCINLPDFVNIYNESTSPRQEFTYTEGYNWDYADGNYSGIYGTTVNTCTIYHENAFNITRYFNQYSTLYDAYGNVRQERLWDYDKPAYVTKSKYSYDNMQRVISATDAEGNTVTQAYHAWGQPKEIIDASGNLYLSDYDMKNNKAVSCFVAKDNIASYRADTNSNTYKEDYVETYLDQFGRTTERCVYENWPVLSGTLSELYRYDIAGNLTGYTDPKRSLNEDGVTTTYQYDALNRITTVKDAINQITGINYTVLGQISTVALKQNASSTTSVNLYTKSYDELGNMIGKADPSSQVTDYSYNTIGLSTKVVDRNLSTLSIAYDGLARVKETNQTSSNNTSSIHHVYNYWNPYGYSSDSMYMNGTFTATNNYSYNDAGQVTKKDITGAGYINSNLKLNYDNAGRLNSVGTGVAGSNYFYSNYKYTNGILSKVQTNGLQAESTSDTDNATYEYYPDGKLRKITYPKLNDNSYLTTEYFYNPLGRMTSMINKRGNTVLSQFQYTYDANGNITSVNDGQTTKTYLYDKLNRLLEIQPQTGSKTVYSYDLRGNRLTETNDSYDLNIMNTSYTYDLENKLQTVTQGTAITSMKYYADGMRAKKETASGYTNYVYNLSGKLVAEAQNASNITSNYVWGPDRVLTKKVVGGDEYYYLYNGHGDVVQMVDRNGNVVNNYQYDEWGNLQVSNETVSNPFKYAGEVYDQETGLYYLRARYYDPTMGRFINEDSYEGQVDNPLSLNLYTYCYNEPLAHVDPSGHVVDTIIDIASIGWSAKDMWKNPSLKNFGFLAWDVVSAFIPFVPGSWTAKGIKAGSKLLSHADDYTKAGVWAMKAFDRGYEIEKALGGWGNNFPVIDKAVKSISNLASSITSIKSMDVTAKTYNKGNNMYNKLKGYVDSLSGFQSTRWGDLTVNVNSDTQRILELALPAVELTTKQADQLQKVIDYAAGLDNPVEIVIKIVK